MPVHHIHRKVTRHESNCGSHSLWLHGDLDNLLPKQPFTMIIENVHVVIVSGYRSRSILYLTACMSELAGLNWRRSVTQYLSKSSKAYKELCLPFLNGVVSYDQLGMYVALDNSLP